VVGTRYYTFGGGPPANSAPLGYSVGLDEIRP
jgi:hypothetical protein